MASTQMFQAHFETEKALIILAKLDSKPFIKVEIIAIIGNKNGCQ